MTQAWNRRQALALTGGFAAFLAGCGPGGFAGQAVSLAYDSSAPAAGVSLRQRALPRSISAFYSGGNLLWHQNNGRPSNKGREAYAILSAASAHGLRPDYYLPQNMLLEEGLRAQDDEVTALTDQALSLGLHDFARDLKFGRFNARRPGGAATFSDLMSATSLSDWVRDNEPAGRSYRDLRDRLRTSTLEPAQRSAIALNMERLRWVPEASWKGPNIRVNIADAILETFDGARRVDTMRVVIGRRDRQTPILVDPIQDLKFSPDWTVPSSIIQKDFLPELRRNPRSFDPNTYDIRVNGSPASAVKDWTTVTADQIFIRRASSDVGPLGGVRFSMYNSDAIFLHDTPIRSHFGRDRRAYSSGCIRVQRAEDLSVWIMSFQDTDLTREEIASRMHSGQTSSVKLETPVEVSLQYMTMYVDGQGDLRSAPDPYRLDGSLAGKMGLAISYL